MRSALYPFVWVYTCPTCEALLGVYRTRSEGRDCSCQFCAPGKRGVAHKYTLGDSGKLHAALVEARKVIALCTTRTFDAQPEDGVMRDLGPRYGFGALMSAASKEWAAWLAREGMPAGSQHTSGPCEATVTRALDIIDAALAADDRATRARKAGK